MPEGVQARATAVLQSCRLTTAQQWDIFFHLFWKDLRKLWLPLSVLCFETKQDSMYRIWTAQERATSEPVQWALYTAEIRQNPIEPARTVPPRDMRQAGTCTPSRSPEKLQFLCEASNQGRYAVNGTMERPAAKPGKSGVQQTCAKSLKGCSRRKDECGWQLGARQNTELKPAKCEKTNEYWENEPDQEFDQGLLDASCVLSKDFLQCIILSCLHIWNKIISKMRSRRTRFQYHFLIDAWEMTLTLPPLLKILHF